jgi:plastocyanin
MTRRALRASSALAAVLLVVACGSSPEESRGSAQQSPAMTEQEDRAPDAYGAEAPPAGGSAETAPGSVEVVDFTFSPGEVKIRPGESVTWTFLDEAGHDVTATGGAFASEVLGRGGTYSFTFPRAGSFDYFCSIHPSMTGTVVVQ